MNESEAYKKALKHIATAIQHHYSFNRHHPEYHKNGVADMTITDKIEMICDWYAATKRHKDGDIYKSIDINQKRFGYTDEDKNFFLEIVRKIDVNTHS